MCIPKKINIFSDYDGDDDFDDDLDDNEVSVFDAPQFIPLGDVTSDDQMAIDADLTDDTPALDTDRIDDDVKSSEENAGESAIDLRLAVVNPEEADVPSAVWLADELKNKIFSQILNELEKLQANIILIKKKIEELQRE